MMTENISWLMTTPSGDCNFKGALKGRQTKKFKRQFLILMERAV